MAHSLHRQHKRCRLCKPHKNRRNGRAIREPVPVLGRSASGAACVVGTSVTLTGSDLR